MSDLSCHEALQRLYEYLDGEVTAETAAAIQEHIEVCARCYPEVKLANDFRETMRRVAQGQPPCPDSLRDKVARLLEEEG